MIRVRTLTLPAAGWDGSVACSGGNHSCHCAVHQPASRHGSFSVGLRQLSAVLWHRAVKLWATLPVGQHAPFTLGTWLRLMVLIVHACHSLSCWCVFLSD